jgi:N-acetylglucosaminyldiphosphoundecaprenol N-acetyl-beta-D-mannosaminyltransferase
MMQRSFETPKQTAHPRRRIMGVDFDALTEAQTIEHILGALDAGRGGWALTANLDILRRLRVDPSFRELVREVDLCVADGMPIVWASRIAGKGTPERVAGSTLTRTLSLRAAERGRSVFLLGGAPGAAEAAAARLLEERPDLRIAGIHCPPMGFERNEAEMEAIRKGVRDAAPDIVYVALGCPKQERLIREIRDVAPGAWWIGVGISLSFLAGDVRRAPRWMQRIGFEWLHRLAQEPRRLFRRYIIEDLPFALRLFVWSFAQRVGRRGQRGEARG